MTRRISSALAALAVTLSLGLFAAPAASAASLSEARTPVQSGSVGLCLVIPLGSLVLPICI
ncbi:hypothetical protein [Rhodococcus marinonascens]|uniref:hypothetical protein n=1 Tax=Rhodococcus marinonascens TaxID=38311 RepID=UPI00093411EE|nr:hypothetical protein [Rhodococcus marinonascens]